MYINAFCTVVLYLSQVNPMLKDNNKLAKHTGNGKSSMYTYITWKVISGTSVAIYSIVGRGMVTTDQIKGKTRTTGRMHKRRKTWQIQAQSFVYRSTAVLLWPLPVCQNLLHKIRWESRFQCRHPLDILATEFPPLLASPSRCQTCTGMLLDLPPPIK